MLCKHDYEMQTAMTRDERMDWWRQARYGMFIHYGLYSQLGSNEWAMAVENHEVKEYEKLADSFKVIEGAPREWAKLAKEAGMKYMVLTTRHHEGFSLWDSKVNPFNSVNYGPKRDIVKEFVEACREYDLKIGFYSSLMDWHHPDGGRCAYDREARRRFTDYIKELNRELMTQYGKIDILWYDVPRPMEHHEGWNSLELNQMVRELQPHIIINNRSRLDEDFGTPEEHITPQERDWEACMTFNGISWGYIDSTQAEAYSYTPQQIIRMINKVTSAGGNLLLNVGPCPDGSLPKEVLEPLKKVGKWLSGHGEAIYGVKDKIGRCSVNGVSEVISDKEKVYVLNLIWPTNQELILAGMLDAELLSVRLVSTGEEVTFSQEAKRIVLENLPVKCPENQVGIPVFELTFDKAPCFVRCSAVSALHGGKEYHSH